MPATDTCFPRRLSTLALALSLALGALGAAAQQTLPPPKDQPYPGLIHLQVDATDLDRRIFQIQERLPVRSGPLTLLFPRYVPGAHGPYGAIERLAGLKIRAAGQELPWQRDTVHPEAFHLVVPPGVRELQLSFQHLSPVSRDGGRIVMTPEMLSLQWISMVLYPAGHYASAIQAQAELRLPAGWQQASALRVEQQDGELLRFRPVSLETLIDSPLIAGRHMRRVELDPPGSERPVALNLVADNEEELQASDAQLDAHRRLVQQADKLFGSRHFAHYDFLLSISDQLGGIGLEHHESSENGVRTGYFKDWSKKLGGRSLLPHEFTHSWNGKFRRPADLWTPDYSVPMQDSLLWLYEGQTDYWGRVLAARSGLATPEQTREALAENAAIMVYRAGRVWRNLQDTTNEGAMGRGRADSDWPNWQRGGDYYGESSMIWLDADTLIREKSGGKASLDDFAHLFFGTENGRVKPLLYSFDDIVATLNKVQPHDWRTFLRERLDAHRPDTLLDGLTRAGWQLSWADTPSPASRAAEGEPRSDDFAYSLGLSLSHEGKVERVMWGSPAFEAGMSRALTVLAINGQAYKGERLMAALRANKEGKAPLDLLVRDGDRFRHLNIDYRDGPRYPRLTRLEGQPERLDAGVLAPRS